MYTEAGAWRQCSGVAQKTVMNLRVPRTRQLPFPVHGGSGNVCVQGSVSEWWWGGGTSTVEVALTKAGRESLPLYCGADHPRVQRSGKGWAPPSRVACRMEVLFCLCVLSLSCDFFLLKVLYTVTFGLWFLLSFLYKNGIFSFILGN